MLKMDDGVMEVFDFAGDERELARKLGTRSLGERLFRSRAVGGADDPEYDFLEDAGFAPTEDDDLGRIIERPGAPRTRARVLSVTGHVIVIELETPSDGFLRPDGWVGLMRGGRALGLGTVDPFRSSPIGPHAKGLILRIVIIGSDSFRCAVGDEITIEEATTA